MPGAGGARRGGRRPPSSTTQWLKGLVSMPAMVVLWAGIWLLGDSCAPPAGSSDVWKEGLRVAFGMAIMLLTNIFFSSAYMDRFDRGHSLRKLGHALRAGRDEKPCECFAFYLKTAVGIAGTVLFWSGVFNLVDIAAEPVRHQLAVQLVCSCVGAGVVLYVIQAEDRARAKQEQEGYDTCIDDDASAVLERLAPCATASAYIGALACNTAQVVLWWGVETLVEARLPDHAWAAAALFVGGLVALRLLDRLETHMGILDEEAEDDDSDEQGTDEQVRMDPATSAATGSVSCGSLSSLREEQKANHQVAVLRDISELLQPLQLSQEDKDQDDNSCCSQDDADLQTMAATVATSRSLPVQALLNGAELVSVVLIWTGCEWFIWDGYMFRESCGRDAVYVLLGLVVLLCTGTFVALAGAVSPAGVYREVHRHLQMHQVPLALSSPAVSPCAAAEGMDGLLGTTMAPFFDADHAYQWYERLDGDTLVTR